MIVIREEKIDNPLSQVKEAEPMRITCIECQKDFIMQPGKQVYFVDKGLAFPKRCDACIASRNTAIRRDSIQIKDSRGDTNAQS
jgi:hypothetical protein